MTYIPPWLRQFVIERANNQCEYCLYPQELAMLVFEMEHIISEKHGGATTAENLALACPYCNRAKGSDLGSIDNPRTQRWDDHFQLAGAEIVPLTPEGRVTVIILQFNPPDRLQERERLGFIKA